MPDCTIMGNSPGEGPKLLSAQAALDTVNEAHPGWNVNMDQNDDRTVYTTNAPGVTQEQLADAFRPQFNGYIVS
jgi:hypothetical protein